MNATEKSFVSVTAPGSAWKKDGHPVPDEYLVVELNSALLQPAQSYVPTLCSCRRGFRVKTGHWGDFIHGTEVWVTVRQDAPLAVEQPFFGVREGRLVHKIVHNPCIGTQGDGGRGVTLYRGLLKARSVLACRKTLYCAGLSSCCHSSSVWTTCAHSAQLLSTAVRARLRATLLKPWQSWFRANSMLLAFLPRKRPTAGQFPRHSKTFRL